MAGLTVIKLHGYRVIVGAGSLRRDFNQCLEDFFVLMLCGKIAKVKIINMIEN